MTQSKDFHSQVEALTEMQSRIAQQLSTSNSQMRSLAKRVWKVQEEERKQIAAELHDGVGQLLTALINQLEQAQSQSNAANLQPSLELARTALSDVRELSRLMRPRILDDLGLEPALQWLVRIMSEKAEFNIELTQVIQTDLDAETQTLIFRVIQEALTNIIKHSQASKVEVILRATAPVLWLKIIDNGVGFNHDASPQNVSGFGLSAMQDRVVAFGGQLEVVTAPKQGCEIKVTLMGQVE
ncbi:sensor histidine kinase [Aliikangiella sp. IMCC44653]